VTISGGLAVIEPADTADSLVQKADVAWYAAKASGRNRTCTHDGSETVLAAGPAARLVELIQSADGDNRSASVASIGELVEFGDFLQRDAISTELAQTCNELRRVIAERSQSQSNAEPRTLPKKEIVGSITDTDSAL
jgi:hypothetical protein